MDLERIKKYKQKTIINGYFGEETICDGCVARGGSEFRNISQPIYSTITHFEKDFNRPYTDIEVAKKYCYSCAKKEYEKEIKELDDCWDQREQEKNEFMCCAKCQGESNDATKFKRYNGINYCLDCLNYVLKVYH